MAAGDIADQDIPLTRGSSEYKAALEIELWKEITQQEFFKTLQKKEEKVLSELSSVFKQEQARLETEVRLCKRSSDDLLKQYKTKLASLEKREKKCSVNEAAFERTYQSFSKEKSARMDEVKQKSNYRGDFLSLELETIISKIKTAEHLNTRLSHRLEETEKAVSLKEMELSNSANLDHNTISFNLQDELFTAKTEFANSKDRLSKVTIAKERYKMKLKSVLEELSKCKQAPNQVQTQIAPIPSLSVPTKLSSEETSVKNKDCGSDVDKIKSELENIISKMSGESEQNAQVPSSQVESEIAKLISERNTLLNTGVYMSDDFVIQQLDKRIKTLLPLEGKSVY